MDYDSIELPIVFDKLNQSQPFLFIKKKITSKDYFFFFRNSRQEVFHKKSVLRNLAEFTGKNLCQRLFFNKVAGLGLEPT